MPELFVFPTSTARAAGGSRGLCVQISIHATPDQQHSALGFSSPVMNDADTKLGSGPEGCVALQRDLNRSERRAERNILKFSFPG